MSTLDQAILDTMTPEEREAFEDSEFSTEEKAALQKIAAGDEDNDADAEDAGDEEGDNEDASAKGAAAPQDKSPAAKPDADAEPAPQAAAEPVSAPAGDVLVPRYEAKLPGDYDEQIQALRDKDAELRQRFKDGEIDVDELDAGRAEILEQREKLLVARAKSEISQEMQQQTAEQQWMAAVNRFMTTTAQSGGTDYRKDEAKALDLDSFVKILANNPANAERSMDWFLTEAHKRVQALHGEVTPQPKPSADNAIKSRKVAVSDLPKTLAQVPGGEGPGDVADEFADIDALSDNDLEMAIKRMTPAERERFARLQ